VKHHTQRIIQVILYTITVMAVGLMVVLLFKVIYEIRRQGEINQQYIRCIILTPSSAYNDIDQRTKAIDKCAIESKLPIEK
jgi:hypothetical protein